MLSLAGYDFDKKAFIENEKKWMDCVAFIRTMQCHRYRILPERCS